MKRKDYHIMIKHNKLIFKALTIIFICIILVSSNGLIIIHDDNCKYQYTNAITLHNSDTKDNSTAGSTK